MSNDETYPEQIARLQREAQQSEVAALESEATNLSSEVADLWEQAAAADSSGYAEEALALMREANAKARQMNDLQARLPQAPAFTGEELDWMGRRPDIVGDPRFQQTASFYHDWVTKQMGVPRFLPGAGEDGLPRNNPQYIELMQKALEPANYSPPVASPDELIQTIRETSKYGKDLTAREYNRGVEYLISEKRKGRYSDR